MDVVIEYFNKIKVLYNEKALKAKAVNIAMRRKKAQLRNQKVNNAMHEKLIAQ